MGSHVQASWFALPVALVKKLVKARIDKNTARAAQKKAK
jgi:hypothetical protein